MVVIRQKNKKWKVDISEGYDPITGRQRRHRRCNFKTRRDAEKYEADYRLNEFNKISKKDRVDIIFLFKLTQKEDGFRNNKQGTIDSQVSIFNNYVYKFFKEADIRSISGIEVKKYREWLRSRPSKKGGTLSNSHINQQMAFLKKMFEVAVQNGIIKNNPCKGIRKLREQHKDMEYYTPEEFKQFNSLFGENEYQFKLLYRMLMFTGLRMGEALALTWEQVNLSEGYIEVKYSAYYRNGKVDIVTVKTKQSNRRIYLHKEFVDELKNWKVNQYKLLKKFTDSPNKLQVYQDTPEILTAPKVSNFKVIFQKRFPQDLKVIRNHDFRHSHASFLISNAIKNKKSRDAIFFELMNRLGHSSIKTTIDTYSHLFPTHQRALASAFDDFED